MYGRLANPGLLRATSHRTKVGKARLASLHLGAIRDLLGRAHEDNSAAFLTCGQDHPLRLDAPDDSRLEVSYHHDPAANQPIGLIILSDAGGLSLIHISEPTRL